MAVKPGLKMDYLMSNQLGNLNAFGDNRGIAADKFGNIWYGLQITI